MRKRLIAYCDGGLGNRLNSLVGAIYFARALDLDLTISWPINRWCAAAFEDLFDAPYGVDRRPMPTIDADHHDWPLVAHAPQAFTLPWVANPNRAFSPRAILGSIQSAMQANDGLVYFNSLVPPYISREASSQIVGTIHVRAPYKEMADTYLAEAGLLGKPYWGLHLRGTDAGFPERYYAFWYLVSRLLPGPIVLCTDDRAVEARFLRNPSVRRRTTTALPTKATENLGWNAACRDEYGREFQYNIFRGAEAVQESMIDFEILRRSQVLPTSQSTFLDNARRFGREPSNKLRLVGEAVTWLRYAYRAARSR